MKKILMVFSLVLTAFTILMLSPGQVNAATASVSLIPDNVPIQIHAGDSLTFNRTTAVYNNITYTEYFRNDPAETSIWGFSSTGSGHYVRYNDTNLRIEGGTWDSHSFAAAYSDDWIDWSFVGDVGTLTFLQDWPFPIVGLYSSVAPTTPKTSWSNSTNISTFATLNLVDPIISPTTHDVAISVMGSYIDMDAHFQLMSVGDSFQLQTLSRTDDVFENNLNYTDIYSELAVGTLPVSIDVGSPTNEQLYRVEFSIRQFQDTSLIRGDYTMYSKDVGISISDNGNYSKTYNIYDGTTLVETIPDISYYMHQTWIALSVTPVTTTTVNYYEGETITSTLDVEQGSLLVKPTDPVLADNTFIGWETESGLIWDFNNDIATGDVLNLTAKFVADTSVLYTISFNTNGGTIVDPLLVVENETVIAPTAPTKDGYTFTGWYIDSELTTLFSFLGATITEDVQLYAKWIADSGTPAVVVPDEPTAALSTVEILGLSVLGGLAVLAVFSGKKKGS